VLEMMKGYLQLAAGLGEMSRRKAMDVARDLVEGTPVGGLRTGQGAGPEALAGQVAAAADELMAIGRQNRRLLAQLVRTETEAVLASLGVRPDRPLDKGGERLEDQLRALHDRVDDLERQLRGRARSAGGASTTTLRGHAGTGAAKRATTARRAGKTAAPATTRGSTSTPPATTRRAGKSAPPATGGRVAKSAPPATASGASMAGPTATARRAATAKRASKGAPTATGRPAATAKRATTARRAATAPSTTPSTPPSTTPSTTPSTGRGRAEGTTS
jgi:hypothetical protein